MQDRFKFRLYDKAIGEMVYDVCVGFIKDSGKTDDWVCADTSCGQITYRDDKLKDIVLMQCTGLKDKNGQLAYEGDIVEESSFIGKNADKHRRYLIVEDISGTGFRLKRINLAKYDHSYWHVNRLQYDYSVIGNKFENPELLEE